MNRNYKKSGFSLAEVLIATGIMGVGLVMVATVFPVGVKLTTLTTERTVGAVVADEAFAKIQLYGMRDFQYWPSAFINVPGYADPTQTTYETCNDYQFTAVPDRDYNNDTVINMLDILPATWNSFRYPSDVTLADQDRNYHWSALCRRIGLKDVQVTVFVSRKIAAGIPFYSWDYDWLNVSYSAFASGTWPKPVKVDVFRQGPKTLTVDTAGVWATAALNFFDDGFTIVDDSTGNIYRVLEVDHANGTLTLEEDWVGDLSNPPTYPVTASIWVVPPAVGSDRYPCVGVYQRVIRFDDIQ